MLVPLLPAEAADSSAREKLFVLPADKGTVRREDGKPVRFFDISVQSGTAKNTAFSTLYYQTAGGGKNTAGVLGPVLFVTRGETVRANITNTLSDPTAAHWHGIINIADRADGVFYPMGPKEKTEVNFTVDQRGALAWLHPHVHGTAAEQVHRGLASPVVIEDAKNPAELKLPRTYGKDDFVLVLADKMRTPSGKLVYEPTRMDYMMSGYLGTATLTNWQLAPEVVVPRGFIRLRLLNASTSRDITVAAEKKLPMYLIATGGGLTDAAVETDSVFLAGGSRSEILVDTRELAGKSVLLFDALRLRGAPGADYPGSRVEKRGQEILRITVTDKYAAVQEIPARLARPQDALTPPARFAATREFELFDPSMQTMMTGRSERQEFLPFSINKKAFSADRIDIKPRAGTWEKWTVKASELGHHAAGHSFHVHGGNFLVMTANGRAVKDDSRYGYGGLQDTVFIPPGDTLELAVPITTQKGMYVYHCHMLEHEDMGMMGIMQTQ